MGPSRRLVWCYSMVVGGWRRWARAGALASGVIGFALIWSGGGIAIRAEERSDPPDPEPRAGSEWVEPILGMKMVWVPGGSFEMGCGRWSAYCNPDEMPVHRVTVADFWIGKYEVTQGEWEQMIWAHNPSAFKKGGDYPVEQVSWEEAQQFIRLLNAAGNLKAKPFRLPTEAEWEYACRGGGRKEKYCGGDEVSQVAWYEKNASGVTHPVGGKAANALGLHDMSGNVGEWVSDWYFKGYYAKSPQVSPHGPRFGRIRVSRGGGVGDYSAEVRAANRRPEGGGAETFRGFRLVKQP